MAEAFLRRHGGEWFEVFSAGLEPKGINPFTRQVMAEKGYDLAGHRSKDVFEFLGKTHFGTIITVCSNAEERCPIFPGIATRLYWPFDDPAASRRQRRREARGISPRAGSDRGADSGLAEDGST